MYANIKCLIIFWMPTSGIEPGTFQLGVEPFSYDAAVDHHPPVRVAWSLPVADSLCVRLRGPPAGRPLLPGPRGGLELHGLHVLLLLLMLLWVSGRQHGLTHALHHLRTAGLLPRLRFLLFPVEMHNVIVTPITYMGINNLF